jgi:hypothetical protein
VVGLTVANITLSRTGGWATFFRDTAKVTVDGLTIVSGYRDGCAQSPQMTKFLYLG